MKKRVLEGRLPFLFLFSPGGMYHLCFPPSFSVALIFTSSRVCHWRPYAHALRGDRRHALRGDRRQARDSDRPPCVPPPAAAAQRVIRRICEAEGPSKFKKMMAQVGEVGACQPRPSRAPRRGR